MRIRHSIAFLLFVAIFFGCAKDKNGGHEVKKEYRILDDANLLTTTQEDSVFSLIRDLEMNIGSQIAVLTIESLSGEKIEELSMRFAEKMKLGRKDFDDGILITVALNDRQMRIEVGYGLENIIKDEIAARITREKMAPEFLEGDYFHGILVAVEELKRLIEENKERVGERPGQTHRITTEED